jgi:hypothetical protein
LHLPTSLTTSTSVGEYYCVICFEACFTCVHMYQHLHLYSLYAGKLCPVLP